MTAALVTLFLLDIRQYERNEWHYLKKYVWKKVRFHQADSSSKAFRVLWLRHFFLSLAHTSLHQGTPILSDSVLWNGFICPSEHFFPLLLLPGQWKVQHLPVGLAELCSFCLKGNTQRCSCLLLILAGLTGLRLTFFLFIFFSFFFLFVFSHSCHSCCREIKKNKGCLITLSLPSNSSGMCLCFCNMECCVLGRKQDQIISTLLITANLQYGQEL